jgi:hypothetical protein
MRVSKRLKKNMTSFFKSSEYVYPVISSSNDDPCNHLQTIPDAPLPASYTQLMKQAGNIRRPYHAQAVAVISLCRFLARHYESLTKDQRTATNVEALEECVQLP